MSTSGHPHGDPTLPTPGGAPADADAVALLASEDQLVRTLLETWRTGGDSAEVADDVVTENWDRGTVGKLLVEHGAIRLAAAEEVRDALASSGREDLAGQVGAGVPQMRSALDQMDEAARGVNGVSLPSTARFVTAVDGMARAIPTSPLPIDDIRQALRGSDPLHSPRFIRTHAPTHPGSPRWYDRVPVLLRLHAAYDRLRGFPWATNGPYTDAELADRLEGRGDRSGPEG